MAETKHSPGAVRAARIIAAKYLDSGGHCDCEAAAQGNIADIIDRETDAPDMIEQLTALCLLGWTVERRSFYDEEGVEGWVWIEQDGTEHAAIGDVWNEFPSWPDSARAALDKAK